MPRASCNINPHVARELRVRLQNFRQQALAPQRCSQPRHSPLPPVLKIASISSSVLPLVSCSTPPGASEASPLVRVRSCAPTMRNAALVHQMPDTCLARVRQLCATLHWCVKCQIHVLACPKQQTQSTLSSTYTQLRHALDIRLDMCTSPERRASRRATGITIRAAPACMLSRAARSSPLAQASHVINTCQQAFYGIMVHGTARAPAQWRRWCPPRPRRRRRTAGTWRRGPGCPASWAARG